MPLKKGLFPFEVRQKGIAAIHFLYEEMYKAELFRKSDDILIFFTCDGPVDFRLTRRVILGRILAHDAQRNPGHLFIAEPQ